MVSKDADALASLTANTSGPEPNFGTTAAEPKKTRQRKRSPPKPPALQTQEKPKDKNFRPSRENARHIGGFFPVQVLNQLHMLGIELANPDRRTVQDMLGESLDDFFQKHGKHTIAELTKRK